jgi:predicted AAA+ superfamily ATPase
VQSLFEVVEPRDDVLAGELTESRFAASLEEVITGTAPDAYGNAEQFFIGTFPSAGLKSLLNEALGRIGGGKPDGASVIRLETNLGGGKTHNLIALLHAARGHLDPVRAAEFMDPALLPREPVDQVGAFVGVTSGAQSFPEVAGIAPRTVWGYLALQVGGAEGYQLVRRDDETLTAPGSDALKRLLGGRPSLIMIDEIARYYRVAKGPHGGCGRPAERRLGDHDHWPDRRVRR